MKTNRNLAFFFIIITSLILFLRIIFAFQGHFLEQVSGSWAAIAVDLTKGILYRPLFLDELGTGGTRWMPLYIAFHALFIKAAGNVVISGLILSLLSGLLLVTAIYLISKFYHFDYVTTLVIIALLLCSNNLLTAMTAIRGDILAAALNILGLYFAVSSENKPVRIFLSCLLFSLTIMAKITSVFGIVTVILWIFFNKSRKAAFRYAGLFAIITVVFLLLIQVVSAGRFINIFSFCADGGTTLTKFVKSPFNFINCVAGTDTGVIIILTTGLTVMFYKGRDIVKSPYALYMAVTTFITVFIFGTEGIVGNHLIDIHIASVIAIAGFIEEHKLTSETVVKISAMVIILAVFINAHDLRQIAKRKPLLASMKETSLLVNDSKTIISENPWLLIIMNREIYMLDPWMFRLMEQKKPELVSGFYKRFDNGGFDCIVFDQNPLAPWIPEWFDYSHFGRNFMNHVFTYYRLRESHDGRYFIYIPKNESPDIHSSKKSLVNGGKHI